MKELSIEEKAKAYDEALERMKSWARGEHPECFTEAQKAAEFIFPELKESEDEKWIPKEITKYLKEKGDYRSCWIAYLEKQGKQKPADKVESKFKVGDFLVNDYCMGRVVELTDDAYLLDTEQGIPFSCEHNAHLWTIQDAKDGDFIVCGKDKLPFIFKGFLDRFHPDCPVAYCGICEDGIFSVSSGDGWWTDEEVFPANKKQREQLEKAITDAGFMWDAKQKKLKKIDEEVNGEDYGIDSLWHAQNILEKTLGSVDGYQSDDGILEHKCAISVVKKLYKQKPTDEEMKELLRTEYEKGKADAVAEMQKSWSEKDEKQLNDIMWIIEAYRKNGFNETHIQIADNSENWLKSLKDRVQLQPIQEWSDEDEKKIDSIIETIRIRKFEHPQIAPVYEGDIDWLKSLKPQNRWKPSDEQMQHLSDVVHKAKYKNDTSVGGYSAYMPLVSLYLDLKKLKG